MHYTRFILILFFIVLTARSGYTQVKESYMMGDTVFRYTADLDVRIESFEDIQLQKLNFPCLDRFRVVSSKFPGVGYELSKSGYREFYDIDATVLTYKGYQGPDPFLKLPQNLMLLNEPVPLVRSNRKDDFYAKSENDFVIGYMAEHLPMDLRGFAKANNYNQLRVSGTLNTTSSYRRQEQFEDYFNVINGYSIQNNWIYSVDKIEFKRDKWETVIKEDNPLLEKYFKDTEHSFLSFYSYANLAEVARLITAPYYRFYYHSDTRIGRYTDCNYTDSFVYVFPNPTYGQVNARFNNYENGKYRFVLANIIGKTIWEQRLVVDYNGQTFKLSIPALSKGIYIYKIINEQGNIIQSRRLVIIDP